jgi:cytochrome P450
MNSRAAVGPGRTSSDGNFLLGHLPQFREDPLTLVTELDRRGDLVRARFGPFPVYFAFHPDLVHYILVEAPDKFYKNRLAKRGLHKSLGNGLLTSDGDFWKRQRKLVQPAFHAKRIESYAQVMVDHACQMMDDWQDGATRDIGQDMMELTLGIVAKTLYDAEVSEEAHRIGEAIGVLQTYAMNRLSALLPPPEWFPTPSNLREDRALKIVNDTIMRLINERRASGEDKGDLLSMLLLAVDDDAAESSKFGGQMTDRQARDEAFTLFTAGHETTALTMTWTWLLLAQNPDAEARLHAELDSVLGGRLPTVADLSRLPYTEQVIKESMRLYPAAWMTGREPIEDVTLAGTLVKKGTPIFISPYAMHHSPRWWDEPERFIPERFADEKKLHKHAYIPFSAGPRVCIGNMFAMMEARLLLAAMAQRFVPRRVSDAPVICEPLVTLRPKDGLTMRLEARKQVVQPV